MENVTSTLDTVESSKTNKQTKNCKKIPTHQLHAPPVGSLAVLAADWLHQFRPPLIGQVESQVEFQVEVDLQPEVEAVPAFGRS